MQDTANYDAWVKSALGFDPALGTGASGNGSASANGAGPAKDAGSGKDAGFFDSVIDLVADARAAVTGADPRKNTKQALLAQLAGLADPAATTPDEAKTFKTLRDAIQKALAPEAPPQAALDSATQGIDKLAGLIEKVRQRMSVAALATNNPGAAAKAGEAFAKYDSILGDTRATPEAIKQAKDDLAVKNKAVEDALALYKTATARPATDRGRKAAIDEATKQYRAAKGPADAAAARDDALVGKASLSKALAHGPLSSETSNPFPDPATAEKLIAAYGKDANMADAAVSAAATAKFPGAIADNVGPMIDRAKAGFAGADGTRFSDQDYSRKYGSDLLKMGGSVGPGYFSGLSDYMNSGAQFSPDGPGAGNGAPVAELAQKRSVKLAGKLIKPDGSIDIASDGAKTAIGNMLFHPDAMKDQTPAMAAHVLKTVDLFKDPTTGPKASNVLKGMTTPTNPAAQTLVRGSLGKAATDPVDANEARTSALASMLKPLDQGPVGSCFATAPARRMRETRPLDAMQAYADLASKGTYKPAFGPEVPAVTSLPPGEDPVMRSWEYSTATAAARNANSTERDELSKNIGHGTDMLKSIAVKKVAAKDQATSWATMKAKLANDVTAGFTFTYDPTSTITNSSDGKSSTGRYIVQRTGGAEIRTQADFETAITEIALTSLGIASNEPEAAEISAKVRDPAFIAAVCPSGYKPWELASGGQTTAATQTLFGDTLKQKDMLAEATDPKPTEGERTKQVLSAFLKNFQGDPAQMVTIRTVGMHGFNALPNDPSLAALKGANDAETAQKMQTNLIDKGAAIKNTALAPDRAGWLFDQAVTSERAGARDPALIALIDAGIAAHRPKAAMKPADVARAVERALDAYHEQVATTRAATWKTNQAAAGKPASATAVTAEKARLKKAFDANSNGKAKDAMMQDLGVPQFVIADSNWGSSQDHTFFVIAPDPVTGEPLLWEKTEPPGKLRPAGRDWVDHEWAAIQ